MKGNEPKPLDLEGIKKKTLDKFERLEDLKKIEYEKLTHSEKWDYLANLIKKHRSGEVNLFTSSYEMIIELTTEEIKRRIKSACEFYLRYKDKPELLAKEHPELEDKIRPKNYHLWYWYDAYNLERYNKWLFKLAFKSVLEDEDGKA